VGSVLRGLHVADLKADERLRSNNQRVLSRDRLIPLLRDRLATRSAAELSAVFEANGLPFAPITRPEELVDDRHLLATGGLAPLTLPDGRETTVPLLPITLDGQRLGVRCNPLQLGEHNDDVLTSLGYSTADITNLREAGVIGTELTT
jgi:crotonobetainyl-CoA:carnitine CoA-transferase CaiB-like acyl-CoA transferase